MSKIPLLDLEAQYSAHQTELEAALLAAARSQKYILGPEVRALEEALASYLGVRHAIGVSSGSDALVVALQSLGVGPGDEVITSAFSFFASAGSIARLGATPRFADIEPETLNISPAAVAALLTARTKAVVPVHLFGRCADIAAIENVAPGIPIVEDAAQAIGAERHATKAGALGTLGCFSFFPSKNLGGFGDGGLVTTDDEPLAQTVRGLRAHGQTAGARYVHDLVGGNYRLDTIQAAILLAKLPHLEEWTAARRAHAAQYRSLLERASQVVLPQGDDPGCRDVYNQFVIRVPNRDKLMAKLQAEGIATAVYYPRGLHQQPCFAVADATPPRLPHTEAACQTVLALPVYPELAPASVERIASAVIAFFS